MRSIKKFFGKGKPSKIMYIPVPEATAQQTKKVHAVLKKLTKHNTAAILVGINGPSGGSLVQADIIGQSLQRHAKKLNVPLITHGEESCSMASFHLLMHGDTILADKCTMLGNLGYRITPYRLKQFCEHWQFEIRYVHHGENKVRLNRFKDLRDEDVQWILNIFNKQLASIVSFAQERRGDKLTEAGLQKLKDGENFLGAEAEEHGLIDRATAPDVYLREILPDNEIGIVKPTWK